MRTCLQCLIVDLSILPYRLTKICQFQDIRDALCINSKCNGLQAVALGIDAKSIPYILKLADFSQAIGQDGKINNETVNNALKKVLEDVPASETSDCRKGRIYPGW